MTQKINKKNIFMPNYTQFKQGPVIPSQTKKKKFTGLLLLRGSVCNYLLPLPLTTTHRELTLELPRA